MSSRLFAACCLLISALSAATSVPAQRQVVATAAAAENPLAVVVERVGRYVEDYADKLSVIIATERYNQKAPGISRTLLSEIALVRVNDDWLGYRDVIEVDGQRIGERADRLRALFVESPQTAVEQGRRIADESARYNIGKIIRNFNVPTTALCFLQPAKLARFRFNREKTEVSEGRERWKITYEEIRQPTIIRTSSGHDMPVKGHVWVRPDDGAILETEMRLEARRTVFRADGLAAHQAIPGSQQPPEGFTQGKFVEVPSTVRVTVSYHNNPALNLLLPLEMRESYTAVDVISRQNGRAADVTAGIECRADYSDYKRFETAARLVVPK